MIELREWCSVVPKLTAFKEYVELPWIINYPILLKKTDRIEIFVVKDVLDLFVDKFDVIQTEINFKGFKYFATLESEVVSKILDLRAFFIQLPRDVLIVLTITPNNSSKNYKGLREILATSFISTLKILSFSKPIPNKLENKNESKNYLLKILILTREKKEAFHIGKVFANFLPLYLK